MLRFSTILCGIDFSDHSARALRSAAQVAVRHDSSLTAIHVLDPLLIEAAAIAYDLDRLVAETKVDLAAFVGEALAGRPPGRAPAVKVVTGRPSREILRAAENSGADLIVLATHGLGGVRKAFFGSTTDRVLHDAGIAVLAVPPPVGGAWADPFSHPRRFVAAVALDRDPGALVAGAASLARAFQAPLTIVHVLAPLQLPPRLRASRTREEDVRRESDARGRLGALAAAVGHIEVEVVVAHGDPAGEVARIAGADAPVVIGSGRPRGIGHHPGATAYRLVCCASVPVLALPEAEVA